MDNPHNPGLSRRNFLIATIATGFALAVRPVSAQTLILTDTAGIQDEKPLAL